MYVVYSTKEALIQPRKTNPQRKRDIPPWIFHPEIWIFVEGYATQNNGYLYTKADIQRSSRQYTFYWNVLVLVGNDNCNYFILLVCRVISGNPTRLPTVQVSKTVRSPFHYHDLTKTSIGAYLNLW